mmetsp:Transcript_37445/g.68502  ORF Transcript_37445/g.68502 Transcript_37445/m.68502 type:complete len:104 (-) Transcript_37445:595-906(-)
MIDPDDARQLGGGGSPTPNGAGGPTGTGGAGAGTVAVNADAPGVKAGAAALLGRNEESTCRGSGGLVASCDKPVDSDGPPGATTMGGRIGGNPSADTATACDA